MDAGNILKPALARGDLQRGRRHHLDEYRKYIEKDAALERRFQPVMVPEPTVEETVRDPAGPARRLRGPPPGPLHRRRPGRRAAELSDRYITDRFLPDKAIDLMDQAGARVRLRGGHAAPRRTSPRGRSPGCDREKDEAVAREDYDRAAGLKRQIEETEGELAGTEERRRALAAEVTAARHRRGRLPAHRHPGRPADGQRDVSGLLRLEEELHERVVGQDEAVTAVAQAVRRARAGHGRPEPARRLASSSSGPPVSARPNWPRPSPRSLFGDEDRMIRFDMSEFQERHTVVPPGRRAPRIRRLRGGRAAHREGPPAAVQRVAVRRDREGAPGRLQHCCSRSSTTGG